MQRIWNKARGWYIQLVNSIAFLPAAISSGFLLIALLILSFDNQTVNGWLTEHFSQLSITNPDNARLLLGTLAGGTLSLTVFSFTMVMVVLSQATNSFSPRVIPGLITKRAHQVVLGFYIGTTLYLLLLILGFQNQEQDLTIPMAGILMSILFGITCLILFVYFIHSISKSIQVNAVLNGIYRLGLAHLTRPEEKVEDIDTPDLLQYRNPDMQSVYIKAPKAGYLVPPNIPALLKICAEHNLAVAITAFGGDFLQAGEQVLEVMDREDIGREIEEKLLACFSMSDHEVILDDAETSMKQISEIGVRALSPGINDPATAKTTLDLLTSLLVLQMDQPEQRVYTDRDGTARVLKNQKPFRILLVKYLSPIRHYGRDNVNLNIKMLHCLNTLLQHDRHRRYEADIKHQLAALKQSYNEFLHPETDRELVLHIYSDLGFDKKFERT